MTLLNMMLGEVAPGGTGSGLYGMLVLAVLTVFVAGLMVGRTPEYLGKKLGGREVKFASLYLLTTPAIVLVGTAVAMALPGERAAMLNTGPHGLSEVLYAFTSAGEQQRQRVRRHLGEHARGGTPRSAWRCCSAASCRSCSSSGWPARSRGSAAVPASDGHAADAPAAVRRHAHRRHGRRRRAHLLPGPGAGAARRRTALMAVQAGLLDPKLLLDLVAGRARASSTRARCGATR